MVYSQWQNRRVLTWSIDFEQKSRCVFRHQVAFFRQKRGETKQTKLLKQQFFCVRAGKSPASIFCCCCKFPLRIFYLWVFFWRELDTVASLKRLIIGGTSRSGKKLSDELLVSSTTTVVFVSSRGGGCRSRWQRPIGKRERERERERGAVAGVEGGHLEREREEGKNQIHLKHRR